MLGIRRPWNWSSKIRDAGVVQEVNISRLHFPVTTLGPGQRVGIWFQGCSIRCEGCISVDTWREGVGTTSVSEVMDNVHTWKDFADGVTITGGEPFDQPYALTEILRQLKQDFTGDVLVYTGYSKLHIQDTLDSVVGCIDVLISEPFDHRESDTLPIRGSDNQKLHCLTDRGRSLFGFAEFQSVKIWSALRLFSDRKGIRLCSRPKTLARSGTLVQDAQTMFEESEDADSLVTRFQKRPGVGRWSQSDCAEFEEEASGPMSVKIWSQPVLREGNEVKYDFIGTHANDFPVKLLCRQLGVQRSAYYDWRALLRPRNWR